MDAAGNVTLIFYRLPEKWWKEPFLNIIAAAAQGSQFTHVEIAIGNESGEYGEMKNVLRIFNDNIGVECVTRTGRNPAYTYLQLGCSKAAELAMLRFANESVGKPFSNIAMARSITIPRTTDHTSYFCAELVAAALQKGGLLSSSSNPGAATPESLHAMYSKRAATTANPYLLRDVATKQRLTSSSVCSQTPQRVTTPQDVRMAKAEHNALMIKKALDGARGAKKIGNFHVLAGRKSVSHNALPGHMKLTLDSLDMRRVLGGR